MIYKNPILHFDFSDPDVIRDGADFYMVASSFNMLPGLPILHSKNLVEWEIINYAIKKLDSRFDKVIHGEGVWAPSIRKHNGIFYIVYPDPDKGIFEIHTNDLYKEFSEPRCLISGRGYEDPCPIWVDDKCYITFAFVKSRIGFNSRIAVIEAKNDLSQTIGDYKIVYDGTNDNPTIEGPKFNFRNGYFYIMAPAGSVKGGWQTCLRSKEPFGPYESKIVLYQGDTLVNGPHQGALIDLDDTNQNYAFVHFQDKRAYGRIIHLEPVKFVNDWPICGESKDYILAGTPVCEHEYLVDVESNYKVMISDKFKDNKLSVMWQRPSNIDNFYSFNNKLIFNFNKTEYANKIDLNPYSIYTKIPALEFDVSTQFDMKNMKDGDHIGFVVMGQIYKAIEFSKKGAKYLVSLIDGNFDEDNKVIDSFEINDSSVILNAQFRNKDIYNLLYTIHVNGIKVFNKEKAYAGRWIGSNIGYYSYTTSDKPGTCDILYYHTNIIK
jgi:beta-xylosidase